MQNREEKLLNHLYAQWTEIYHLKGVCLAILKDLEQKETLSEKEQYWQSELLTVLFESESI